MQQQRDSAKSLRYLIDNVSKNLRALKTLGEKTDTWDSLVIHLVSAKLDSPTSAKWEEFKNTFSESPSLNDFFQFLKGRSDVLESIRHNNKPERQANTFKGETNSSFHKFERSHAKSFAISASPASSSVACVLCNGSHRLYDCDSFLGKPVDERIADVVRLKLCFNCLRKGHSSRQCRTYRTRDRFLRLEFLRRLFWKRWMLEYITQLQARQKWRTPGTSLQLGDLVLLKEENAPPMHWKVGRITALFPGEDGVARAADVRTTTGTYRRGTRYLCPLLDPAAYSLEATASNAPEDVPAHC
ncbi:uncharacterized protein LOC134201451 [Bombyx mori]|uniref:uncharacterized protein LOC134201451 n=1 Tax=Bombyx mori TaxID=7091 RepID=UPI002ED6421F